MPESIRAPTNGGLTGHDIAICALISFYAEGLASDLIIVNDRLLAYIVLLTFDYDAPAQDLQTFLELTQAYLCVTPSERDSSDYREEMAAIGLILSHVTQFCEATTSLRGLRGLFTRLEAHLTSEETLDTDGNVIKASPQQVEETSPIGTFLCSCIESHNEMEEGEVASLMQRIRKWCCVKSLEGVAVSDSSDDIDTLVGEALSKGNYAGARTILEGSFSTPPAEAQGTSLAGTLYRNAQFHYRTLALDSAKESLEEALRLARGTNEVAIIAKCDALDRRIKLQQQSLKADVDVAHDIPKPRQALSSYSTSELRFALDEGASLVKALDTIDDMAKHNRLLRDKKADDLSLRTPFGAVSALETDVWRGLGSSHNEHNSIRTRREILEEFTTTAEYEMRLLTAISDAQHLYDTGATSAAIELLLDGDILSRLDIDELEIWHAAILRITYHAARRSGFNATCDKLAKLCPELLRGMDTTSLPLDKAATPAQKPEPNEATVGRRFTPTHEEHLRGSLAYIREMLLARTTTPTALTTATEMREIAEKSGRFRLARAASSDAAAALAQLDMVPQALDVLDELLPRVLGGHDAECKADVCFKYAKALLSSGNMPAKDDASYEHRQQEVLSWLDRALSFCNQTDYDILCGDVQYCRARVLDNLQRRDERDEAARQCLALEKTLASRAHQILPVVEEIQQVAALAGARIAAGV